MRISKIYLSFTFTSTQTHLQTLMYPSSKDRHSSNDHGPNGGSNPSPSSSSSSFYNMQMYSPPSLYTNARSVSPSSSPIAHNGSGLYQNIHEVSYHPAPQVQKNGIVFTDPFAASNPNFDSVSTSRSSTRSYEQASPVTQPLYATFGTDPMFVTCPYCHHTELTEVERAIGSKSLLWACIVPCFGFLFSSQWDTRHRCKNCLNVIGIHFP